MSEQKHTDGYWRYDKDSSSVVTNIEEICEITLKDTTDEEDANGHLIAAAPDMLRNLDQIARHFTASPEVTLADGTRAVHCTISKFSVENLLKLINRAKGNV